MKTISRIFRLVLGYVLCEKGEVALMGGGGDGGGSNDGGGDGGDGGGGSGGGGDGDGDSDGGDISYPEGFDETLKGNKTLLNFYDKDKKTFDNNGIMKAFINAKSMIGSDKMLKPQTGWTDDQWGNFYKQSGLPENMDSYKIENRGLPEGTKQDDRFMDSFKEQAFKTGIRPNQAEKMIEWFNGQQTEMTKQSQADMKMQFDEGMQDLKRDYGSALKGKLERGMAALKMFASADEVTKLHENGYLDDPNISRLLIKLADGLDDSAFSDEITTNHGMTPTEAADKMQEMMKKDHPYMKTTDRKQREILREEWSRLAMIKNSGKSGGRTNVSASIM